MLLNNVGIRVRTITVSSTGEAHDEISYLSPDDSPVENILSLLAAAQDSSTHSAQSDTLRAQIDPNGH